MISRELNSSSMTCSAKFGDDLRRSGEIRVPSNTRVPFLPPKPYLPIGTLREVVSYPMAAGDVDAATLRETLEVVGLPNSTSKLVEELQLSLGEQQIAFARSPSRSRRGCFLDEATSSMDESTESLLNRLVRKRLPGTTLFSIGHRATLRHFMPCTYRCSRR